MRRRSASIARVLPVIGVLAALSTGADTYAQSKTGTTVGVTMLIEPSARVAAMGNAGVTTFREAQSGFYNPGALGHLEGSDAQFTHSRWLADITFNYAAAAIRIGASNTILLSVTALNSGDIDVRTVAQPDGTGERYTANDLVLGLGFSRRITDRFSAGAQVKFWQQTIWHTSTSALALDFGVLYELPFRAFIGASVSNFGTRASFDGRDLAVRFDQNDDLSGDNSNIPANLDTEDWPLPILFRVGIGFPVITTSSHTVLLVADAFQPSDNTESISLGGEWTIMDVFSARAGYQHLFREDNDFGLTLGGGLKYDVSGYGFRFDYAWGEHAIIGDTQRFTVGFSF